MHLLTRMMNSLGVGWLKADNVKCADSGAWCAALLVKRM